jgi:RNA ligase
MLPSHISWSSIELLHNVVRTLAYYSELNGEKLPTLNYRAKIKQHGSNCAVQVTAEGIFAQSRTQMLVGHVDYKGFARWVAAHEAYWRALPVGLSIFGEWCGPGVESGMAISQLDRKVFAVFAIQEGRDAEARIVYDSEKIRAKLPPHPDLFVLPWWEPAQVTLNFADAASLDKEVERLNQMVEVVEKEDPWVKDTFGISGLGEGLVFYPVTQNVPTDPEGLARFMFKAKGLKHRTAGTKEPVQVAAQVVSGAKEFVALMVTEARLQQGLSAICGDAFEMKQMRAFLEWISADVKKESVAELEASGLTWEQVQKEIQSTAREWFKAKATR